MNNTRSRKLTKWTLALALLGIFGGAALTDWGATATGFALIAFGVLNILALPEAIKEDIAATAQEAEPAVQVFKIEVGGKYALFIDEPISQELAERITAQWKEWLQSPNEPVCILSSRSGRLIRLEKVEVSE